MSVGSAALVLVGANLAWSASAAVAKVALEDLTPPQLAFLRMALASLVLLPVSWRLAPAGIARGDRTRAAVLGVLGFALSYGLEYGGIRLARASNAAVFIALEPLGIVLAAAVLLRERVSGLRVLATAVALAGVALVSSGNDPAAGGPATLPVVAGNLLLLGAVACNVFYTIGAKPLLDRYPPLAFTAFSVAAGAAALAPAAAIDWLRGAGTLAPSRPALAAVLYLAFVSTVLGYLLWNSVLVRFDASFLALFLYVQPVSGVLVAWALVDERPTGTFVAGAALILAAVWLATRGERKAGGGG
ncbi:MAG TPA: DMT family transporter [Thermodesulfobacteriota bacterium]